jgi:glycosyltransferase involved in cell wall biosynthesis
MNDVDVIIPVHGKPIYLEETINSIIHQKYINKIYLVLDRVEREYINLSNFNDKKIVVLNSTKPGIVEALNLGLKNSQAKYIARIDSDDLMQKDRIKQQRELMEKSPDCVCVGSFIEIFGNTQETYIKKYPSDFHSIKKNLEYQNAIAHPSVMYKSAIVKNVGGYRNFFEGAEDYDLWFRLSKIGEIKNLQNPLTRYRISEGQYSSKFSKYRITLDSLVRIVNLNFNDGVDYFDFYQNQDFQKVTDLHNSLEQVIRNSNKSAHRQLTKINYYSKCVLEFSMNNRKSSFKNLANFSLLFIKYPIFTLNILSKRLIQWIK